MAKLAIKGHKDRGKGVIALLEMLGGKNKPVIPYDGSDEGQYYFITEGGNINISKYAEGPVEKYIGLTLEAFEEEFPYKVGDEVRLGISDEVCITNMYWDPCSDQVIYEALSVNGGREYDCLNASQLSSCKEQTSPDKAKAPALEGQNYSEGRIGYRIPEGFELDKVEDGEIILKPKKKELPKTYGECLNVLGLPNLELTMRYVSEYEYELFKPFIKLIRCRDAYWKLADDWSFKIGGNSQEVVYAITIWGTGILKDFYHALNCNRILVFPTEEMRDAFYENFKDLINECKELL